MSVFDQAETKQQSDDTQQQTQEDQTTESWVKKLVEERGEKWSDPEVIAKGKYESDKYIGDLERQLSEMREDLSKNEYAKTLLETLQGKAGDTASPKPEEKQGSTAEANTTNDASDLESLVEEAIRKREAQQTASQNLKQVDDTLQEAYGTEAASIVKQKASELGMSLERLQEIASESPTAFIRLIGEAKVSEKVATPKSSVNTQSDTFNKSGEKNWEYYQNLRRTNSKQYYSPKVQNQLMADRQRLGDRFYQS